MSGQQPYAVRLSPPAVKALETLPEHAEQMVWDVLDAAAGNPWGFPQLHAGDPEGEWRERCRLRRIGYAGEEAGYIRALGLGPGGRHSGKATARRFRAAA